MRRAEPQVQRAGLAYADIGRCYSKSPLTWMRGNVHGNGFAASGLGR